MKLTVVELIIICICIKALFILGFFGNTTIHNNMFILGTNLLGIKPGTSVGVVYNG